MVLHRYINNAANRVPDRLRNLTINTGIQASEAAIAMECLPELSKWYWYSGSYQQWHIAFLLLTLIDQVPSLSAGERIMKIIEYVFEPDPSWPQSTKTRVIIEAIRDRSTVYRDLRKMRVPANMVSNLDDHAVRWEGGAKKNEAQSFVGAGSVEAALNALKVNEGLGSQTLSGDQDWSFDTPATLYQNAAYLPGKSLPVWSRYATQSQTSPQSQQPQSQSLPQPQQPQGSPRSDNQSSPGLAGDFHSPSDSSTNESWPPLISGDQLQWRTVVGQGSTGSPGALVGQGLSGITPQRPSPGSSNPFLNSGFPNDQVNIPQFPPSDSRGDSIMMDINWVSSPFNVAMV